MFTSRCYLQDIEFLLACVECALHGVRIFCCHVVEDSSLFERRTLVDWYAVTECQRSFLPPPLMLEYIPVRTASYCRILEFSLVIQILCWYFPLQVIKLWISNLFWSFFSRSGTTYYLLTCLLNYLLTYLLTYSMEQSRS